MKRAEKSLNQLRVGDECSTVVHISKDLLDSFIIISGDDSKIHQDAEYAKNAGFKSRVVHGALISSFFSALIGSKLPGDTALLLDLNCRFHRPAFVDEEITVSATVAEVHEAVNCITLNLYANNAEGEKLATGRSLVKVRCDK